MARELGIWSLNLHGLLRLPISKYRARLGKHPYRIRFDRESWTTCFDFAKSWDCAARLVRQKL